MPIDLSQIHTIRHLYNDKTIIPPKQDQILFKPSENLLDRVSLFQGDITKLKVDAIVNAANRSLLGGGGVDGAIHRAAGRDLLKECRTLGGCETGNAKITKGYDLPSLHVIHAVGPIYSGARAEENAQQLGSCYKRSLEIAAENSLRHIAFCSISTGIYGYPIKDATHVALTEVRKFFGTHEGDKFEGVVFVVFSDTDREVYETLLPFYFAPEETTPEETNPEEITKDVTPAESSEDKPEIAAEDKPEEKPEEKVEEAKESNQG